MTPELGLQQRILGRLSDEWHTIGVLVMPGEDERTIMTTLGTLEQQGLVEGWGSLWRLRDAQPDAPASGLQPDSPTGRAHDGAPHCSPPPVEPDAPRTSGEVDAGADGSVTPEASGSGGWHWVDEAPCPACWRDDLEETEAAVLALLDHAGAPAVLTTVGRIGWLWARLEVRDAG